jgi:hypothetical protein
MTRKSFFIFVFLFAGFIGFVAAEPGSTYQPQEPTPDQKPEVLSKTIVGTIENINLRKTEITIKDTVTNSSKSYNFNDATTFYNHDSMVQIRSFKPGDQVSVELDSETNRILRMDHPSKSTLKD